MLRRTTPLLLTLLLLHGSAWAQATAIPPLVSFAGKIPAARGSRVVVSFALYSSEADTTPLWLEKQDVSVDAKGAYTVHLGANDPGGLPMDLFSRGEARWLGVQPEGQPEQPRILLAAVPYALKAADADTLGGRPLSAFLLAPAGPDSTPAEPLSSTRQRILPTLTAGSFDPSSPGPIGDLTPDTGTFTTLTANGRFSGGTSDETFLAYKAFTVTNPSRAVAKFLITNSNSATPIPAAANRGNYLFAVHTTRTLDRLVMWMGESGGLTVWDYITVCPSYNILKCSPKNGAMLSTGSDLGVNGTSLALLNNSSRHDLIQANRNPSNSTFDSAMRVLTLADSGLLAFGGKVSGVPALKPSGTTLTVRAGDDSADAGLRALDVAATQTVSTPRLTGITDTGLVTNLNADMVDGVNASDLAVRIAPPLTSTAPCTVGQWAADTDYFYTCVVANVWRRAALSSW